MTSTEDFAEQTRLVNAFVDAGGALAHHLADRQNDVESRVALDAFLTSVQQYLNDSRCFLRQAFDADGGYNAAQIDGLKAAAALFGYAAKDRAKISR